MMVQSISHSTLPGIMEHHLPTQEQSKKMVLVYTLADSALAVVQPLLGELENESFLAPWLDSAWVNQ